MLLLVLVFSPLAFGTVEPWSHAISQSAALAALAIALHRRIHAGHLRIYAAPGALPLLALLGFLLLQATPLPPALVRLLSPAAHERWSAALGGAGALPWLTLSLDPLATLREFFRFSACAAVYLLSVQLLARRERVFPAAALLALFAAALSFEAILQFLIAPNLLLFFRTSPGGVPFGPFVNRNHYANLMAMLTPVVLGLFLGSGLRGGARTWRGRLADVLARPESSRRLLLGFATVLAAGSLVISLSRGAMLAVSASLLAFGGCLLARGIGRRRTVAAALCFAAFTVFVGWFGWEKVADRFASLSVDPDVVDAVRAGFYRDTLRMSADFPVVGAGIGSFSRIYPAYRTVAGNFSVAHAHNDHLELLAGGGMIGLGLFSWFVGAVLLAAARACWRRHDPPTLYLAFGALAGCVAFVVHGASDFSLAIGANALYFFFLLGFAVSVPNSRATEETEPNRLGTSRLPAAVSHLAAAFALLAVLGHGADLAGRHLWRLAGDQRRAAEPLPSPPAEVKRLIVQAERFQPLEAAYPAALARIALNEGNVEDALALTRRALRLLPVDPASLLMAGSLQAARGEDPAARRSFAAAVAADPAAAATRERFGAWLVSRGDRDAGLAHLREAMALDPGSSPRIFGLLVLAGLDDEGIAAVVPPNPAALLRFARYAMTTGARRLAAETYSRVLAIDPGNREAAAGLRKLEKPR
jgi:O-antigen ligase